MRLSILNKKAFIRRHQQISEGIRRYQKVSEESSYPYFLFLGNKQGVKDGQLRVERSGGIDLSRKPFLKRKVGGNV
jgi:hypothetical protein